jgi:hypothetical protein
LLVTLAELNKTLGGLVDLFKLVKQIFERLNRRVGRARRQGTPSRKQLAELYMQARYNLRPLYYDCIGLLNALNLGEMPKRQTFRAHKSEFLTSSEDLDVEFFNINNYVKLTADIARSVQTQIEVRAGVLVQVDNVTLFNVLGLDSIVASAWDLVTLSFVFDWFINIGDLLMAWTPNLGLTPLASWTTVETTSILKTTLYGHTLTTQNQALQVSGASSSVSPAICAKVIKEKVRDPEPELPVLPSIRLNLDPLKLIDLGLILKGMKPLRNGFG